MMIPPGKLNGSLPGPYYFGGGSYNAPEIDMDAQLRNAQASAGFAREQSELAHAQALEMEATRNAYASAISEREQQNEAQLEAQQQSMEDMLSDVQTGVEEDEEEGITSVNFFTSLMNAMQGGTGTAMPGMGGPMTGDDGSGPTMTADTGAQPYSGARPV